MVFPPTVFWCELEASWNTCYKNILPSRSLEVKELVCAFHDSEEFSVPGHSEVTVV
jgi:hypothetical protein